MKPYNPAPPRPHPRIIAPKPVKCKPAGFTSTLKCLESLVEPNLRHDNLENYTSRPMIGLNFQKVLCTGKKQLSVTGVGAFPSQLTSERSEACGPPGIFGHMECSSSASVPFFPCHLPPGRYVPRRMCQNSDSSLLGILISICSEVKTPGTYHSARFEVFKIPNPSTEDIAQGSASSLQDSHSPSDIHSSESPNSAPSDMFPSPYSEVNTDLYAGSDYSLPSLDYGFAAARESLFYDERQIDSQLGPTMRLSPVVWPGTSCANFDSYDLELYLPRCSCVFCK